MLQVVLIVTGLVLLLVGGDTLVKGAVALAKSLKVSPLLIGLVVVALGTSMPEFVTSLYATFKGSVSISIGNVIGSNISNILLILGVTAAICRVKATPRAFYRDGTTLMAVTFLFLGVFYLGTMTRIIGILFLVILLTYMVFTYFEERNNQEDPSAELHIREAQAVESPDLRTVLPSLLITLLGIALTVFGARILVDNSIIIAKRFHVPESIIGLTLVAIGTSLPELAASLIAALKRQPEIALGNIIGSNLLNILGILGTVAVIQPFPVSLETFSFDAWIMAAATTLMMVFILTGWRISHREGLVCLLGYICYITHLVRLVN